MPRGLHGPYENRRGSITPRIAARRRRVRRTAPERRGRPVPPQATNIPSGPRARSATPCAHRVLAERVLVRLARSPTIPTYAGSALTPPRGLSRRSPAHPHAGRHRQLRQRGRRGRDGEPTVRAAVHAFHPVGRAQRRSARVVLDGYFAASSHKQRSERGHV